MQRVDPRDFRSLPGSFPGELMQIKRILKLSVFFNLVLLVGLAVAGAWIGKIHLIEFRNYRTYVISTFKANRWIGQSFPVMALHTATDTVHIDCSGTKGSIVLLFDPSSCQPCLETSLENLQQVWEHLDDTNQFSVYAVSSASSTAEQFVRAFELKYPLGTLVATEDVTYDVFFERTPVVFLLDSRNMILQCHYPLYGREQFTHLFFWKLVSIQLPALKVSTRSFEGSPLKSLEGVSLLDVIKGSHSLKF